ncbi:MAG: hypothetical protein Q8R24_06070, partial [Legionellaceae bacterium]|nr:hypothetical protein [Legionellaceae bacterium]
YYWVKSNYFMKTVAYSVINELVESNGSQVSWTERHEAFFMSFCPKSNYTGITGNSLIINRFG